MTNYWNTQSLTDKKKESLVTAIYVGAIFIILALVYLINLNNNLFNRIVNFFSSFIFAQAPGTNISLPAPANPAAYMVLYTAAFQLSIGIAILEITILALRIFLHSPLARKAETIENIVFWLGASYLIITYLFRMTIQTEWFVFWAGIILIAGLSMVARAFVLLVRRNG
ncbi:MAG: hypothetical protein ABSA75_08630 [Candidatus Bathyarchaeia archaeon]